MGAVEVVRAERTGGYRRGRFSWAAFAGLLGTAALISLWSGLALSRTLADNDDSMPLRRAAATPMVCL